MKIIHIITGLNTGGAEIMLYKLISHSDQNEFKIKVISLTDIGPIGDKIKLCNIPVEALGMKAGVPNPSFIFKLASILRKEKPDLVQTWMYHADLIGGLAAKMANNVPTIWGIHHSNLDPAQNKQMTLWTVKVCAKLSGRIPAKIVCCSEASKVVHNACGYNSKKLHVIPNGFDLKFFKPDSQYNESVRSELGLNSNDIIVGNVARFDPLKDHTNLVNAAAIVHRQHPKVHFLLCGEGINDSNNQLFENIKNAGVENVFHLLGRRSDIPRLTASFDIACLSSCGEGFPNVVGEAMACEVPCVVTNVGDSASIVDDTGLVVPPHDAGQLADALIKMIDMGEEKRRKLGIKARQRVITHYSIRHIVQQYEDLYKSVIS